MAIYKITVRGKTRYLVRYRDVHSRAKQSKRFDTRDEAEQFEAALVLAKHGGVRVKRQSTQTLRAFWAEYVEKFARHDLQAATLAGHKQAWAKWIEPELGGVPLATLASSPELIQVLKSTMADAGAGAPTQRRVLSVLSAVLTKAVELQRIVSNPVKVIRKPPVKRGRPVIVGPEVVSGVLANLNTETDRRLVALIAFGGLRPAEALALEDTDIAAKTISVTKALKLDGVGNTKTNSSRVVTITGELRPFLGGLPSGPLFVDRDGKHWTPSKFRNWRIRNWQRAAVKAGIGTIITTDGKRSYVGARPYDLRHFAASSMLYRGVDPVRVAQAMGHSPAVLYSTYAHVIAESQAI